MARLAPPIHPRNRHRLPRLEPVIISSFVGLMYMTLNPYEPASESENGSTPCREHPFALCRLIHRPLFVAVWVGAHMMLGVAFFFAIDHLDPVLPVDFAFYLRLFQAIGGVFGLLSWYIARLVSLNRMAFSTVAFTLLLPFGFVTMAALDQGPLIAILTTIGCGEVLAVAYLVRPLGQ